MADLRIIGNEPTIAEKLGLILAARAALRRHKLDNGRQDPRIAAWIQSVDEQVTAAGGAEYLSGHDEAEELGLAWAALPWLVPAGAGAFGITAAEIGLAALAAMVTTGIIAVSGVFDGSASVELKTQAGDLTAAAKAELLAQTANRITPELPPTEGSAEPKTRYLHRTSLLKGSLLLAAAGYVLGPEMAAEMLKCWKSGLIYAGVGFAAGAVLT